MNASFSSYEMLSSSDPTSPDRQTDLDEEDILSGPIEDGEYSEREHWERGFWGSKPDLKNILTPEEEMKIRSLLTSEPATYLFATSSAPASAKERQARWRIRKQYKLDEKDRLMRLSTLQQHHDGEEKRAAYLPVVTTSTIFNELATIHETIDHAGANKTWSWLCSRDSYRSVSSCRASSDQYLPDMRVHSNKQETEIRYSHRSKQDSGTPSNRSHRYEKSSRWKMELDLPWHLAQTPL